MQRVWFYLPAILLSAACGDSPTEPRVLERLVIGTIDAGNTGMEVLVAPDTATSGEPVTITVTTFANPCFAAAGAEVIVRGSEATITPYDQETLGLGCSDVLDARPRQAIIIFNRPGEQGSASAAGA